MRLNEIHNRYRDRVEFLVIYTAEAHPSDGLVSLGNIEAGIDFKEPVTDGERTEIASVCQVELDLQMPLLIDGIDNAVEASYVTLPMRLFVVDAQGKIAYTGERGPRGFDPAGFEDAIKDQLALA